VIFRSGSIRFPSISMIPGTSVPEWRSVFSTGRFCSSWGSTKVQSIINRTKTGIVVNSATRMPLPQAAPTLIQPVSTQIPMPMIPGISVSEPRSTKYRNAISQVLFHEYPRDDPLSPTF
jgi:hypothetical protein